MRSIVRGLGLCALLAFGGSLAGCDVSPSTVERWENRPGSEERFIGWLQSDSTSQEVKNKSLELLLRQWEYSAPMFRDPNRNVIRGISNETARNAALRANISTIRDNMDGAGHWRFRAREQAYVLRNAVTDPDVRAEFDGLLEHWLDAHWDPCEAGPSAVSTRDAFNAIGEARGNRFLVRVLRDADFQTASVCLRDQAADIEWLHQSDATAEAFAHRWVNGPLPAEDDRTGDAQMVRFLEFLQGMASNPTAKAFMIERAADPQEGYRAIFQNLLGEARSERDLDALQTLLAREDKVRWYAFRLLIDTEELDGLRRGLTHLPRQTRLSHWDADTEDPEAFRRGTEIACASPKLTEIAEGARPVLLDTAASSHPVARVVALVCLSVVGDASSIERLQAIRGGLGEDVPLPHWTAEGNATLQGLIDGVIAAISSR